MASSFGQIKQNPQPPKYRIWIPNKDMVLERCSSFRRQKPSSVMVWAGVTSTGLKTPLIFIDKGVKINQTIYSDVGRKSIVQETVGEEGITLQQDGATSHTAKAVALVQDQLWPPSSPDLNPILGFGPFWSNKPAQHLSKPFSLPRSGAFTSTS